MFSEKRRLNWILLCAFLLLAALSGTALWTHVFWRDEAQSWAIAWESHSIADLIENLRFEHHSMIWPLLLMAAQKISSNPIGMKLVHGIIALSTVVLLYRSRVFSTIEKILISFGYYFAFEYFVISRDYLFIPFFMAIFLIWRERQTRKGQATTTKGSIPLKRFTSFSWIDGLLLGLIASMGVHGIFLALGIAVGFLVDEGCKDDGWKPLRKSAFGIFIFGAMVIFSIGLMKPDPEFRFWSTIDMDWHHWALHDFSRLLIDAFFPLPKPSRQYWGSSIFDGSDVMVQWISAFAFFAIALFTLYRRKVWTGWLIFLIPLALSIGFSSVFYFGNARHHGIVFLAYLVAYWAIRPSQSRGAPQSQSPSAAQRQTVCALLVLQVAAGLVSLWLHQGHVFSRTLAAAEWLKGQPDLSSCELVSSQDYAATAVSSYLGRPVLQINSGKVQYFVRWNKQRELSVGQDVLVGAAQKLRGERRCSYWLFNQPPSPDLASLLEIGEKTSFEGSTIPDENFWIFRSKI
jgi:hypothetical protein